MEWLDADRDFLPAMLMLLQTLEMAGHIVKVHSYRCFFIDEDFESNMERLPLLRGRPKASSLFRIMRNK